MRASPRTVPEERSMPSDELQAVTEMLRANPLDPAGTIKDLRAGLPETRPRRSARITPAGPQDPPGEWVIDATADPDRRLLYLHGGGYISGSPTTHRNLVSRISQAATSAVFSLDYARAPERPFPAAIGDATVALNWLLHNGPSGPAPATATFLAGDSAGGGLALAALIHARDAGERLPDAAALLSPWTDLTLSGKSMRTRAAVDPNLNHALLERMAREYLSQSDAREPLASPLFADLAGLPPLLIQVGDAEILLDDSMRLADRARAAGVDVTLEVYPDEVHVFQAWAPILPEGQEAIKAIADHLHAKCPTR